MKAGDSVALISDKKDRKYFSVNSTDNDHAPLSRTSPLLSSQAEQSPSKQRIDVFTQKHSVISERVEIFHSELFQKLRIAHNERRLAELKEPENSESLNVSYAIAFNSKPLSHFSFGNELYHILTTSGIDLLRNIKSVRDPSRGTGFM